MQRFHVQLQLLFVSKMWADDTAGAGSNRRFTTQHENETASLVAQVWHVWHIKLGDVVNSVNLVNFNGGAGVRYPRDRPVK